VNYKDLVHFLKGRTLNVTEQQYLLIDEVQEIEQWEKAINSYLKEGNWDIYLTGSNAHMLSSELATLLSGRYVVIPVYSLSLPEFLQFNQKTAAEVQQMF
jgi:predicted AAA+ superfamily ATPase